jgi:hypothetical protein
VFSNSVSVLLGNGNGTFQSAVNFGVGSGPFSAAVADVNGDGRPDLVTANYGSASVSVLLGNGNGTFKAAKNFAGGSAPQSVAVADVNGDGRPDVAVNFGGDVGALLGNRKAATHLQITARASVTAGTPFTITVTALAPGNGVDDLYTGTVTFTSSDGAAVLPANYTFTKADLGVHTFTVTLNTTGSQTVTATDTVHGTITGTATVTVNAAAAPSRAATPSGGSAATSAGVADTARTFATDVAPAVAALPRSEGVFSTGLVGPAWVGGPALALARPQDFGAPLGVAVVPSAGIVALFEEYPTRRRDIDRAFAELDSDPFGDGLMAEEGSEKA